MQYLIIFSALKKLRGKSDVSAETVMIQDEAESLDSSKKLTFLDMFRSPLLLWSLTIAVVMMLAQQWSGINVVCLFVCLFFKFLYMTSTAVAK